MVWPTQGGVNAGTGPYVNVRRTYFVCGDSRSAEQLSNGTDQTGKSMDAWRDHYSYFAMTFIGTSAVGGAAITPGIGPILWTTQIQDAIASGATDVIIDIGVNDFIDTTIAPSLATVKAEFLASIQPVIMGGQRIILRTIGTIDPLGNLSLYNPTRQAQILEWNRWLRQIASSINAGFSTSSTNPACILSDTASVLIDPTSSQAAYKAGYVRPDGVHQTNRGAQAVGKYEALLILQYVPEQQLLITSNADNYPYSNIITNSLADGLNITNNQWSSSTGGTGAQTSTLISSDDNGGNWLRQTVTFQANGDVGRMRTSDFHTQLQTMLNGSACYIWLQHELDVAPGPNYQGVRTQINFTTSIAGNKAASFWTVDSTMDRTIIDPHRGMCRTYPILYDPVSMGNLTNIYGEVAAYGLGGGLGTWQFRRASIEIRVAP